MLPPDQNAANKSVTSCLSKTKEILVIKSHSLTRDTVCIGSVNNQTILGNLGSGKPCSPFWLEYFPIDGKAICRQSIRFENFNPKLLITNKAGIKSVVKIVGAANVEFVTELGQYFPKNFCETLDFETVFASLGLDKIVCKI